MKFNLTEMYPYLIALGLTALIVLLIVLIYLAIKKSRTSASYDEQLEELLEYEYNTSSSKVQDGIVARWNRHWAETLKGAGFARYNADSTGAGRDIALIAVAVAVLGSALMGQILIGPVLSVLVVFGASMFLRMKADKKSQDMNLQLPGFLFSLKANLQASETNERALLKVVDSMPSPLYDDLLIVKNRLLANGSFKEALEELSAKTSSRDLKFLCACMIQAAMSGSNMVTQLDSIQKVLEARRKVGDEIQKAVKTVQPAIWLSSAVIPALFLASYFMDASSREFWFIDPMSWIALGATVILYIAGMLLTKNQVDKIKNM